jgi:hypothetical protein
MCVESGGGSAVGGQLLASPAADYYGHAGHEGNTECSCW